MQDPDFIASLLASAEQDVSTRIALHALHGPLRSCASHPLPPLSRSVASDSAPSLCSCVLQNMLDQLTQPAERKEEKKEEPKEDPK